MGTPFHPGTEPRTESPWWFGCGGHVVPDVYTGLGTELTVQWADFWGRPLGPAAAQVCEYPFIDLSRQT